jgi:hypothetical protein
VWAAKLARQRADVAATVAELRARLEALIGPGPPAPPTPPAPTDPLRDRLAKAFEDDAATLDERKDSAKDLAALFRAMVDESKDPARDTAKALLGAYRDAAARLLKDPTKPDPADPSKKIPDPSKPKKLMGVRTAVGAELGALFPADGPLSDEQRAKAAALFARLAAILDTLGG